MQFHHFDRAVSMMELLLMRKEQVNIYQIDKKKILHSSIDLSHVFPNQSSAQIHANRRDEIGIVAGDSRHSPCWPHGLIGLHNENGGETTVVEDDCVVVGGNSVVVVVVVVVVVADIHELCDDITIAIYIKL
jgi:hypothetical protein